MKMDLKDLITDLADKPVEGLTVGIALANIAVTTKGEDPLKLRELGEKFYKEETVDLDAADLELVKRIVKSSEVYTPLVTGFLLKYIQKAELKPNKTEPQAN